MTTCNFYDLIKLSDAESPCHEAYGGELVKTDSGGKMCPFCPENGKVEIIERNDEAYLIKVVQSGMKQPGRYFIIPNTHYESVLDLPDDWTQYQNHLIRCSFSAAYDDAELLEMMGDRSLEESFNLSWNQGHNAGQRVKHIHLWVMFRYDQLQLGFDGVIGLNRGLDQSVREHALERKSLQHQLMDVRRRFGVQLND